MAKVDGKILFISVLLTTGVFVSGVKRNTDTLKLVQVVFRHGDRAPTKFYPNDPYINDFDKLWPEGFAQLTNRGKMQQYELGQFLRNRYDGYLAKKYSPTELYVTSSDMDRTIMSLESNLAGLFPPAMNPWNPDLDWQPIPLRTIPRKEDRYLHNNVKCPKYSKLRTEFYSSSQVVLKLNQEHQEFIQYCAEHSGLDITTVKGLYPLLDIFYAQDAHNYTLPSWAQGNTLSKLLELFSAVNTWPTYTNEMKRLWGGPLLHLLLKNMQAITGPLNIADSGNSHSPNDDDNVVVHSVHHGVNRKMIMYSAHDSTLGRIMNTMGVFDPQCPPYASALIIELHQDQHSLDYHIEIHFRNDTTRDPYLLTHPNCGHPCKLETYMELTRHLIPTNWKQECQLDGGSLQDSISNEGEEKSVLKNSLAPSPWTSSSVESSCSLNSFQFILFGLGLLVVSTVTGFLIITIIQCSMTNSGIYEGDHVYSNGKFSFLELFRPKSTIRRASYEKL